ncbi:TPA: GNAT family N-acetyltransferase [Candidatus Bathyarchaeota archaeon]|nr:GNAT family N-acetyltransferase [Candidatus Bathyarchaeota archaeon]
MGEGYTLRTFRAEDLNRVMAINFECLPENYSSSFYRELYSRFPETFIVAEADGEIQGYIMCRVERGFSKLKSLSPARLVHVVSIATREQYRRRGIAKVLMFEAMKKAAAFYEATECYLEVRVGNEPAIKLYEYLGFAKTKRNYGYYLDGEDAWVMSLAIPGKGKLQ